MIDWGLVIISWSICAWVVDYNTRWNLWRLKRAHVSISTLQSSCQRISSVVVLVTSS